MPEGKWVKGESLFLPFSNLYCSLTEGLSLWLHLLQHFPFYSQPCQYRVSSIHYPCQHSVLPFFYDVVRLDEHTTFRLYMISLSFWRKRKSVLTVQTLLQKRRVSKHIEKINKRYNFGANNINPSLLYVTTGFVLFCFSMVLFSLAHKVVAK